MKLKKIIISILICFITIEIFSTNVKADDYLKSVSSQEINLAITNRIKFYNSRVFRETLNQENVFFNLRWILGQASIINALENIQSQESSSGKKILDYPYENIKSGKEKVMLKLNKLNDIYGTSSDSHEGITLEVNPLTQGDYNYNNMVLSVKQYTTQYLDKLLDASEDIDSIAKQNKRILKQLYLMINEVSKQEELINSYIPDMIILQDSSYDVLNEYQVPYTELLKEILKNERYEELISTGRSLCQADEVDFIPSDVELEDNFLSLFTELTEIKEGVADVEGVKEIWYKIFSCGAIYEPFVSSIGDDRFKQVLNLSNGEEPDADSEVWKIYKASSNYCKPLYRLNKKGDEGVLLTLGELKDSVINNTEINLYTVKGRLEFTPDVNSFNYYTTQANMEQMTNETTTAKILDTKTSSNKKVSSNSLAEEPILSSNEESIQNRLVLFNIFKNYKIRSSDLNSTVYTNMFGDIFLSDDTVILSGCSNANYYKRNNLDVIDNYYVGTMAFMRSYPNINLSQVLNINKKDDSKMVITMNENFNSDFTNIIQGSEIEDNVLFIKSLNGTTKIGNARVDKFGELANGRFNLYPYNMGDSELVEFREHFTDRSKGEFGWSWVKKVTSDAWDSHNLTHEDSFMHIVTTPELLSSTIGRSYLDGYEKSEIKNLVGIACSFYHMIYDNDGELTTEVNENINEDFIIRYFINEMSSGTDNLKFFDARKTDSYEDLIDDKSGRLKTIIKGLMQDIVSNLSGTTGTLGLENSYQSVVFGKIVAYGRTYIFIVMVAMIVAIIIKYVKEKFTITHVISYSLICCFICWVYINVVPVYMPMVVNGAIDLVTAYNVNELGYNAMAMRMEDYETTYGKAKSNISVENSSSINIFKLKNYELEEISDLTGIDKTDLLDGSTVIIDNDAGIYIQGNNLKVSLDCLFLNNSITGVKKSVAFNEMYQLEFRKNVSSNIDYYTCYNVFLEGMVRKLNGFLTVFTSSSKSIQYNGFSKESFVMENYIKSPIFLEPENKEIMIELYGDEVAEFSDYYLGDYTDTFGFKKTIKEDINDTAIDTIWYRAMIDNGYMDTEERIDSILDKVTYNTKLYLINNFDKLTYMSDENIIKATALYATVEFQRLIGQPTNEVYPMFINIEEFTLGDVLNSVYINDVDQYRFNLLDISTYMIEEFGVFWSILFTINTLDSFVIINVAKISLPVLYIFFGILLFMKFMLNSEKKTLIKGYSVGVIVITLGFFFNILSYLIAKKLNDSVLSIVIPLVINSMVVEVIYNYIMALISNPLDLGGKSTLSDIAPAVLNKIGITDVVTDLTNKTLLALHWGKTGAKTGNDMYKDYRDTHGYNYYTGQEAVISDVVDRQDSLVDSRINDIDTLVRSEEHNE